MSSSPVVWCLLRDQFAHVKPVETHLEGRVRFVYDAQWHPATMIEARPDLVLCVNDISPEIVACLDAARGASIPSLLLQDGVLEWRCQYQNPRFGAGGGAPQHQPVVADKIACLGARSARFIAGWGNADRVECTGMPRLDVLLERRWPPPEQPGRTLLIMTAKKPGFDENQRLVIKNSLGVLKEYLDSRPDIQVIWRITKGLHQELGVQNTLRHTESADLMTVLEQCDAVISTPSTALLEAMLAGRPCATLDFFNTPRFNDTAWTISAAEQVPEVVTELLAPPPEKMLFQRDCLHDSLRLDGMAAPRVARLVEAMIEHGRRSREQNTALQLPATLTPVPTSCLAPAAGAVGLPPYNLLYPGHEAFETSKIGALQTRLARAMKENERLQEQLGEEKSQRQNLEQRYAQRPNVGSRIRNKLSRLIKRS